MMTMKTKITTKPFVEPAVVSTMQMNSGSPVTCERWFHGKCVRITPAKAEHIKHYKCPDCNSKKMRQ
jgi:hypothetical protein